MSSFDKHNKTLSLNNFFKFLIPSLIGIFLFMIPISNDDSITIPVAILSNWLLNLVLDYIPYIILALVFISAIGTLLAKVFKCKLILNNDFLESLFNTTWIWAIIRFLAFVFVGTIILVNTGNLNNMPAFVSPAIEMITSADTGNLVMGDLLPILFSIFFFAGLLLPLLLNFGLLEFIGALLVKVMRPIFNLPGRSAIDCIASWLGDGTIGVLLTSKQYEDGFYTEREAAVIGTNFSLVSITFSLVVINTVGLGNMFIPFYLTVTIASIIAAIIIPKLPPLSKRKDTLFDGSVRKEATEDVKGRLHIKQGFENALAKAEQQNFFKCVVVDGLKNVIDMWIGVIPVVMGVGTISLIIATYTPLFSILGLPFQPLLQLLGIPEAAAASHTLISGFADMLLPSILAANIESDMTRFVVASVSVSQLIYLSEVGALLLGSKIPINLKDLFIIFIERTLVTLPVVALIAHILF